MHNILVKVKVTMSENQEIQEIHRIHDVMETDFLLEIQQLRLNEDQMYNALYYILFQSNDSPEAALYEAAQENYPFISDDDETRYGRKFIVLLIQTASEVMKYNRELVQIIDGHGINGRKPK